MASPADFPRKHPDVINSILFTLDTVTKQFPLSNGRLKIAFEIASCSKKKNWGKKEKTMEKHESRRERILSV